MTPVDWSRAQREDPIISKVIDHLVSKQVPRREQNPVVRTMLKTKGLVLLNGVLHRQRVSDKGEFKQLVLPEKWRKTAFEMLHTEMGHMGRDRTCDLFRKRFFFPRMQHHISVWIQNGDFLQKEGSNQAGRPIG